MLKMEKLLDIENKNNIAENISWVTDGNNFITDMFWQLNIRHYLN